MKANEIYNTIAAINEAAAILSEQYEMTEGEVTTETEAQEALLSNLRDALANETDDLGRWLVAKEAEKAQWAAELDACRAKMKATEKTIDYIKGLIAVALDVMGEDKVKGNFYGFTRRTSLKVEVSDTAIKDMYQDAAIEAIRHAGIPAFVNITLRGSSTAAKEAGVIEDYPTIFSEVSRDTVLFTKPKTAKK
jgi:hypothetical protein